jgi:hypothetical protein
MAKKQKKNKKKDQNQNKRQHLKLQNPQWGAIKREIK